MWPIITHLCDTWSCGGHAHSRDRRRRQETVHRVGPRLSSDRVVLRDKMLRAHNVFLQLVHRSADIDVQGRQPEFEPLRFPHREAVKRQFSASLRSVPACLHRAVRHSELNNNNTSPWSCFRMKFVKTSPPWNTYFRVHHLRHRLHAPTVKSSPDEKSVLEQLQSVLLLSVF